MSPLSFDNGQTDCNVDSGDKTVDEKITTAKMLVNFGERTLQWQPILWREMATSWHIRPLSFVLAFYNGWEYRNADCALTSMVSPLRLVEIS